MREELIAEASEKRNYGITPACAGRTSSSLAHFLLWRDHPRVCGKNKSTNTTKKKKRGSPPRVREEPYMAACTKSRSRITPACAGRTPRFFMSSFFSRDHPRVCGKNSKKIPFLCLFLLQTFHKSIHFCCELT